MGKEPEKRKSINSHIDQINSHHGFNAVVEPFIDENNQPKIRVGQTYKGRPVQGIFRIFNTTGEQVD